MVRYQGGEPRTWLTIHVYTSLDLLGKRKIIEPSAAALFIKLPDQIFLGGCPTFVVDCVLMHISHD